MTTFLLIANILKLSVLMWRAIALAEFLRMDSLERMDLQELQWGPRREGKMVTKIPTSECNSCDRKRENEPNRSTKCEEVDR